LRTWSVASQRCTGVADVTSSSGAQAKLVTVTANPPTVTSSPMRDMDVSMAVTSVSTSPELPMSRPPVSRTATPASDTTIESTRRARRGAGGAGVGAHAGQRMPTEVRTRQVGQIGVAQRPQLNCVTAPSRGQVSDPGVGAPGSELVRVIVMAVTPRCVAALVDSA
jgi:hypothetical protein